MANPDWTDPEDWEDESTDGLIPVVPEVPLSSERTASARVDPAADSRSRECSGDFPTPSPRGADIPAYDLIYWAEALVNVVPSLHQINDPLKKTYWTSILSKALELGLSGMTLTEIQQLAAEKEDAYQIRRAEIIQTYGRGGVVTTSRDYRLNNPTPSTLTLPRASAVVRPRSVAPPSPDKAANTAKILAALREGK